MVRVDIARCQERSINYAPEWVTLFPYQTNKPFITHALQSNNLNYIYYILPINKM